MQIFIFPAFFFRFHCKLWAQSAFVLTTKLSEFLLCMLKRCISNSIKFKLAPLPPSCFQLSHDSRPLLYTYMYCIVYNTSLKLPGQVNTSLHHLWSVLRSQSVFYRLRFFLGPAPAKMSRLRNTAVVWTVLKKCGSFGAFSCGALCSSLFHRSKLESVTVRNLPQRNFLL